MGPCFSLPSLLSGMTLGRGSHGLGRGERLRGLRATHSICLADTWRISPGEEDTGGPLARSLFSLCRQLQSLTKVGAPFNFEAIPRAYQAPPGLAWGARAEEAAQPHLQSCSARPNSQASVNWMSSGHLTIATPIKASFPTMSS